MSKFINSFYIFSKLSTSFVLLLVILLMGYALFESYKSVDDTNSNLDTEIQSLSILINKNISDLNLLNKKLENSNNSFQEIKKLINEKSYENNNSDYKKELNELLILNQTLQEQINELRYSLTIKNDDNSVVSNNIESQQVNALIDLIRIKYKNGEDVSNELLLLDSYAILLKNKDVLEKLSILELKKFHGLNNFNAKFDQSMKQYLKAQFMNREQNSVIYFLSKFISIEPSKSNNYENEEVNIIIRAKEFLDKGDINQSLGQILLLNESEKYFSEWITQANTYLEFNSELEKVN